MDINTFGAEVCEEIGNVLDENEDGKMVREKLMNKFLNVWERRGRL